MSKGIYFLYQHSYQLMIWQFFMKKKSVFRRFTFRRTRQNILIDYSKPQSDMSWLILDRKKYHMLNVSVFLWMEEQLLVRSQEFQKWLSIQASIPS